MTSRYTTVASLYVAITRLLDGEDVTVSDMSVASLGQLLDTAQKRIYGDVRSRWNERAFDGDAIATDNLVALPDDFVDLSIAHFGRYTLIPVDETVIRDYWSASGSHERYIAHAGNYFTFWPAVADETQLQGRYYARLPDLTDANLSTNALFQNADDVFIYGALVESAPFFGARQDMATWEAKYQSIVTRLNKRNHRAAYSAGRLMMRPSAKICGRGAGRYGGQQGIDAFALAEDSSQLGID